MGIDRRTVLTGLVSAGALLQAGTQGEAASGPVEALFRKIVSRCVLQNSRSTVGLTVSPAA